MRLTKKILHKISFFEFDFVPKTKKEALKIWGEDVITPHYDWNSCTREENTKWVLGRLFFVGRPQCPICKAFDCKHFIGWTYDGKTIGNYFEYESKPIPKGALIGLPTMAAGKSCRVYLKKKTSGRVGRKG